MGRDEKRVEVSQSNDDRNEDRAKCVCDVDSDRSWEDVARGECRNRDMVPSSERLEIILATGTIFHSIRRRDILEPV
jgi:hypothetical protein